MKFPSVIACFTSLLLVACTTVGTKSQAPPPATTLADNSSKSSTRSTPAPPKFLSLSSLPTKVRTHNPQLAAARNLIDEARARLGRAGLAANPDLSVEFETNREVRDLMLTIGIDQQFPRTNRLALEKKVSATLLQAAEAEVADGERKLIGESRHALIEILALREEKKLIKAQEKNARQLAAFIESAADRGEASSLDAGTALIEASRLGHRARQMEIREQRAIAKLKPLFGIAPDGPLEVSERLPAAKLPPMLVAASNRPDLKAAQLRAQSAAETTTLEQARKYEDLEAGIFAGAGREEDAPNGLESEQIIGLRLKIPLPLNNDNSAAVAESAARERRLTMEAKALRQNIIAETSSTYEEMKQWAALANEIKSKLVPLSEKQIADTRNSYERGELPLQDVLRAQEQKLSLETAHLEALRDFHFAHTQYLTATARH